MFISVMDGSWTASAIVVTSMMALVTVLLLSLICIGYWRHLAIVKRIKARIVQAQSTLPPGAALYENADAGRLTNIERHQKLEAVELNPANDTVYSLIPDHETYETTERESRTVKSPQLYEQLVHTAMK